MKFLQPKQQKQPDRRRAAHAELALGGSGIGGFDVMKIEDLVDQLGQLGADKWKKRG